MWLWVELGTKLQWSWNGCRRSKVWWAGGLREMLERCQAVAGNNEWVVTVGDVGSWASSFAVVNVDSSVDKGCFIKPTMSVEEVVRSVRSLSVEQKYKLLTEHFVLTSVFKFPKTFDSGCNRSFQVNWLKQYPWLVYSKALDGGFCKYCALFVKDRSKCNVLVNKPFNYIE